MKKIIGSLVLLTGVACSAEITEIDRVAVDVPTINTEAVAVSVPIDVVVVTPETVVEPTTFGAIETVVDDVILGTDVVNGDVAEMTETSINTTVNVINAAILQLVGEYLQNKAANDLTRGAEWVNEEVIRPVEHYATEQAPNDIKKISKRAEKNIKNEGKKAGKKVEEKGKNLLKKGKF